MRLIRLLKRDLAKECSHWVDDNIITETQAETICSRYGIDYHTISNHSYAYTVLISLGYLFIGLAVITLLSANWEEIPRAVRMLGLIALTLGTHGIAFRHYQHNKSSLAIGLFFLGSLFYGASIMLIAQIYHIEEHYPNGIYWWAMGVLPLAVLLRSTLLMALFSVLFLLWAWVEASLSYYPLSLPIFLGILAWHIFRVKQSNLLFLAFMIGLGAWIELTMAWFAGDGYSYNVDETHFVYAVGIVICFYGFAQYLNSQNASALQDYGTILKVWILRFALFTLFIFSFDWLWKELIQINWKNPTSTLVIACLLGSGGLLIAYFSNNSIKSTLTFVIAYLAACFVVIWGDDKELAIYCQIATNLLLVTTGVWLITKGITQGITHYFFLGVVTILVTGLLRYIDLVGDYIGAAILFIIFALILLGAARFWKIHNQEEKSA